MANKLKRRAIKRGMGGSRCGRGRSEKTADMKHYSKKLRRKMGREVAYGVTLTEYLDDRMEEVYGYEVYRNE